VGGISFRERSKKDLSFSSDTWENDFNLSSRDRDLGSEALEAVLNARDQRFVSVLVEVMRGIEVGMLLGTDYDTTVSALETLSGQSFGANWPAWVEWYGGTDLSPPPGFSAWKGDVLTFIDPRFADFLNDDATSDIRVEEIVWGGVSVDGIPALDNAPMVPADQAGYLLGGEPVFGVAINGDTRAYPLRILDWHEMANDVVGGVPMSLAYCTLCGAGIAFDGRASDGGTYDFGSSGFLYRSNKLMYDRQTRTLWNQLTGEPVLGELVGANVELELLPVVLTSWEDWLAQHPGNWKPAMRDTIFLGPPTVTTSHRPRPCSQYGNGESSWIPRIGSTPCGLTALRKPIQ
jgi:hypothetical protein